MKTISPVEAFGAIEKGEALILDVRTSGEFAEGHIESAQNIDISDPSFEEQLKELDPEAQYVVYCQSGGRSGRATSLMQESGFAGAMNMTGGITAWKAAGLPVEK